MTQYMQEAGAMKQADELHAAIMNLRADKAPAKFDSEHWYKIGHRDARHAAAELALAAALPPAAVQPDTGEQRVLRKIAAEEVARATGALFIDGSWLMSPDQLLAFAEKVWNAAANEGTLTAGKQGGDGVALPDGGQQ